MTRRQRGAIAVVAGVLLSVLGIVELVGGAGTAAMSTTTTVVAAPATTSTAPPTSTTEAATTSTAATTTTIEPGVRDVEDFVDEYRLALDSDDVGSLFDWLHPGVKDGYGEDLCRDWVTREIAHLESYELAGPLIGPSSATISTNGGTFQVEDLYGGPIRFVYQGAQFEDQAQFVVEDGSIYWLGICR